MKNIQEITTYCFGANPPKKCTEATKYLQCQLKDIPEDKQLEWAKERRDRDVWGDKYGLELTRYYNNNDLEDHFEYKDFIWAVAMLCVEFYDKNGGEMSAMTRRALERSASEFGYADESSPIVISEGKDGSGKFIVSSIL